MVSRDPTLVISLVVAASSAFTAREGLLLDCGFGLLCSSRLLGLGEEGLDVGLVDKVAGTSKGAGKEEV